ncbi:MAG: response regulator [Proteobacteria bacterium]|nr:response regulator [Pseudomonadota bacterium]
MGQLASGIAHDFNNLLAVVIGSLDLIEMDLPQDSKSREQVEAALGASLRGAELAHQLLAFARKQPLMAKEVDLNASVRAFSRDLRGWPAPKIILDVKFEQDQVLVKTDPAQLEKALKNLVMNAAEAMPLGGRVVVQIGPDRRLAMDDAAQRYACLSVSDEGCGVPADQLTSVFEPFFSTKPTGTGGGLGLSMVHGFVKQSGGEIEFMSEEGAGTTVRLYFPKTETPALSGPTTKAVPGTGSSRVVLVVDDDASVRASVVAQLSSLGYATIEAADGVEALQRVAEAPHIDLVFTDILMPGLSGAELGREIAIGRPDLRVLYTSGFVGGSASDGTELPADQFLAKPYRKQDLKLKMDQVLAAA